MGNDASLEQWKKLYDITVRMTEIEPWTKLGYMDIVTVILKDTGESCYFSLTGKNSDFVGIRVYVGKKGLQSLRELIESDTNGVPIDYVMYEQNCLVCYFGDREDLIAKQKKIIKDLDLKFRGRGEWIYFQSFQKGYAPGFLNKEEVELLTVCFEQFYSVCLEETEHMSEICFGKGKTLVRKFDEKQQKWCNVISTLPNLRQEYDGYIFENDILKARMKKQRTALMELELDGFYLRSGMETKELKRPIIPKLLILMNHVNGLVISQQIVSPEQDEAEIILNFLIEFVMKYGRPTRIIVRLPHIQRIVSDICKGCRIKVMRAEHLSMIDEFKREFMQRFGL